MRFPWMGRVVAMAAVVLTLVWALSAVQDVVRERSARQHEAEQSVASSLASDQTLVGPWLVRECTERYRTLQGEGRDAVWRDAQRQFTVQAAPSQLSASTTAGIEPRRRGIFKVNGYVLTAQVEATWASLSTLNPVAEHEQGKVECQDARWVMAVSDPRGIREATLRVEGRSLAIEAGTGSSTHRRGVSARLPVAWLNEVGTLHASLQLTLVGTRSFAFAPIGEANQLKLAADWPHPSFDGRFLPTQRQVDANHFEATWQVSTLASTARENLLAGKRLCPMGEDGGVAANEGCVESFGVAFIDPVNPYVLSDRATKYGLLFIVLTFVAVGLVEVLKRLRVHPVQYMLVGAALVVFFLLLVSLSETWAFVWAYLTAAAACTGLLAFYAVHVLGDLVRGLAFGMSVAVLYGVLYVLLRLEQGSLLMGSMLLFVVLAAVMALTRKVDWYRLGGPRLPTAGASDKDVAAPIR